MKTEGYLLDTNILIYLLEGDAKVGHALDKLKQDVFYISVISHFEFLVGQSDPKQLKNAQRKLSQFVPFDFRRSTAEHAALLHKKINARAKLKDLFIAATALEENLTLVTADQDFKKIPGLSIHWYKP